MTSLLIAMLLLAGGVVSAQQDGVTVTVAQNVSVTPTLVNVMVNAIADSALTLDQVVERLQGTGVTAKDFLSLASGGPLPSSRISYQFRISAPFSKLKDTLDALDRVRRTASDLDLQYFLAGSGVDDATARELRQKVTPDLVAEARRRAQELSGASGAQVGRVLGVTETISIPPAGAVAATVFVLTVRFSIE